MACLFAFGYLASVHHDVTVRHALCAEHGEWVHEVAVSAASSTASADEATPHWTRSGGAQVHEHCPIVVVTREVRWLQAGHAAAPATLHRELAALTPPTENAPRSADIDSESARGPPSAS